MQDLQDLVQDLASLARKVLARFAYFSRRFLPGSLQTLFQRPHECERWRYRSNTEGKLRDIYDGRLWKSFMYYQNEPFLSQPGNLGLASLKF